MKVKAKDIAKAAGVSTTAVSLVLNGKDSRISEATKEKILRISREMAFQSEITVQPGGSQRVKTLGLVLPDLKDPVFYKLLIYIQEYAFQKGYIVFFCACGDDVERCCTIVEGLVVKNVDGLAVVAPSTLEKDDSLTKTLHTVQDNGVPLVLLDRAVYSIFSDFVTTDNKYGGRAAAEKLVQAGAKQIGCILGPAQVYTTKKRYQGFQEGVASSRHITGNRMFFTEALPRKLGAPRLKRCMHRAAMAFLWKMTGWRRARWQRLKKKASVLVRTANLPSTITKAQKMLFPCVRTFR